MKYVANLFTPIPKSAKSHVYGWSNYWATQLGATVCRDLDEIGQDDVVYVDHGVNFGGGLNLFGGANDEVVYPLVNLAKKGPKLVSLDLPMPNYAEQLEKRLGAATTSKRLTPGNLATIKEWLATAETLKLPNKKPEHLTFGDSHATAYSAKGVEVHRTNGQTLYGLLQKSDQLVRMVNGARYNRLRTVTVVAGSIDIRHHLLRQPKPIKAVRDLMVQYMGLIEKLKKVSISVHVAAPVPVEWPGRRIPQTGFYEGAPFYGSQDERAQLTQDFIKELKTLGVPVVAPPAEWYTMNPEIYAKEHMELGGSVHISPSQYRSMIPDQWRLL